jgi:dsRNA-specific ribonuclease
LVEVAIDDKVYASGCDFSIKGAEKLAAEKAFNQLQIEIEENPST